MLDQPLLPPTTTLEQNLRSAGQRNINRIWEFTQASIAVLVTVSVMYAVVFREQMKESALIFLTNALMVVIGFYFGRTNHQRTGGIGGDTAGPR